MCRIREWSIVCTLEQFPLEHNCDIPGTLGQVVGAPRPSSEAHLKGWATGAAALQGETDEKSFWESVKRGALGRKSEHRLHGQVGNKPSDPLRPHELVTGLSKVCQVRVAYPGTQESCALCMKNIHNNTCWGKIQLFCSCVLDLSQLGMPRKRTWTCEPAFCAP